MLTHDDNTTGRLARLAAQADTDRRRAIDAPARRIPYGPDPDPDREARIRGWMGMLGDQADAA